MLIDTMKLRMRYGFPAQKQEHCATNVLQTFVAQGTPEATIMVSVSFNIVVEAPMQYNGETH